jgi:hypothetical protein
MSVLRNLIPNRPRPMRVLRGPFRGARVIVSPRHSLRQIFGLYEHEMNGWLEEVLPRVESVLDVGANNGYFSFGCAAAFRRLHKSATIHAFEPDAGAIDDIQKGMRKQPISEVKIEPHRFYVLGESGETSITLNEFATDHPTRNTLIKIDVEGAEVEVIKAASAWLNPTNYFLIEVHWDESFLDTLKSIFAKHSLPLIQINQQPLPILGRENRGENSWWLVSEL